MTQSQILMSQSLTESMIQEIKDQQEESPVTESNPILTDTPIPAPNEDSNQTMTITTTNAMVVDSSAAADASKNSSISTVSITDDSNSSTTTNTIVEQQQPQSDYEQSVTDKENQLLGSFNQLNLNNVVAESQPQVELHSNGKKSDLVNEEDQPASLPFDDTTPSSNGSINNGGSSIVQSTELLIEDAINNTTSQQQTNGHKNGAFDDVLWVSRTDA